MKNYFTFKKLMFLFLFAFPYLAAAGTITVNSATELNALNGANITNGTVIALNAATYTLTQTQMDAFTTKINNKSNISIIGSGTVTIKASGTYQQLLNFNSCTNLLIQNIILYNGKIQFSSCNDSTLDNINSSYVLYDITGVTDYDAFGKLQSIISFSKGNNNTMKNCTINYNNTQLNSKIVKSYRGTNPKFINNIIIGKIQGAYEIWTCQTCSEEGTNSLYNGYSGALVQGGYIERVNPNSLGGEDHGLYFHDVSRATIDGLTTKGFSETSSGGGVKIKNSDKVEVKNSLFYTAGILVRTGSEGWQHINEIYIHHNSFYSATPTENTTISTYMTPTSGCTVAGCEVDPVSLIYEYNKIYASDFSLNNSSYPASKINQTSTFFNKSGGIRNNGYSSGRLFDIGTGINNSGNYILSTSSNINWGSPLDPANAITTISSPANGATVSNSFGVTATATTGYDNLSLKIDGVWTAGLSSNSGTINLSNISNGQHTIEVYGSKTNPDGTKTYTASDSITVTVSTPPGPTSTHTETLENIPFAINTWGNQSYTGNENYIWTANGKKVSGYVNSSFNLYNSNNTILQSATIAGGISSFSVECVNKWNSGANCLIELLVNGQVKASSNTTTTNTLYTFSANNINITGNVTISLRIGSQTIAIDNITWRGYGTTSKTKKSENKSSENTASNDMFKIYPNPVKIGNNLNLEYVSKHANNSLNIIILNLLGQKIFSNEFKINEGSNSIPFDTSCLQKGVYLIKLNSADENFVKRIIIE